MLSSWRLCVAMTMVALGAATASSPESCDDSQCADFNMLQMQIGLAASKLNSTAGANLNQETGLAASKLNGTASQSAGGCSCYLCNRQSLQSGYCSAKQSQAGQACWNNRESPGCYSSLDWNPCKCAGGVAQPRVSGSPPEGNFSFVLGSET